MPRPLPRRSWACGIVLIALASSPAAAGQEPSCVPASGRQLTIYRAGSLTAAFKPLVAAFTCQTGIQVKDVPMGSIDAARQITAGGQACDLYAPADDTAIDVLMKPAGFAAYTIVFARGKMVLVYSARALAAKHLPPITDRDGQPFDPSAPTPKALPTWYQTLTAPGVSIGAGHPFLDPGAYRADLIFQLAQAYHHVPNLYNTLLEHVVIPGPGHSATALGDRFDAQFAYEHNARTMARNNPDVRYADLPDEISLADPAKDAYYREHALVVLPGLGTPQSARTVVLPATRVAWGITVMTHAPNSESAVRFLEMLLGQPGAAALTEFGPAPLTPALVSPEDWPKLPKTLRALVRRSGQ